MVARKDDFQLSAVQKTSSSSFTTPGSESSWWLQPSVEWQNRLTDALTVQAGVRLVEWLNLQNSKKNEATLEPTANIQYQVSRRSQLNLGFSTQTQMVSPQLTIPTEIWITLPSYYENITKSHNLNLAYQTRVSKNILAKIEAYYQYIFDASTLSINSLESSYISSTATGRNAGIELDIQQQFVKGFYWRANASFFDAKYKVNTDWVDSRFNAQYVTNALIGKEWTFSSLKNRFLGVNAHTILRGGFIDPYRGQKLNDYFRMDLNVYWKVSHNRYASTVQLDLQNLTNQQNDGWLYFDRHQGKVLPKYQLGLIPNLAYKVEF